MPGGKRSGIFARSGKQQVHLPRWLKAVIGFVILAMPFVVSVFLKELINLSVRLSIIGAVAISILALGLAALLWIIVGWLPRTVMHGEHGRYVREIAANEIINSSLYPFTVKYFASHEFIIAEMRVFIESMRTLFPRSDSDRYLEEALQRAFQDLQRLAAEAVPRQLLPPKEPLTKEAVRFTAYHPKEVPADIWATLHVYTHIPAALDEVRRDKSRLSATSGGVSDSVREIRTLVDSMLTRGVVVTIQPICEHVQFNPPSASFLWLEDWHRTDFRFWGEPHLAGTSVNGNITVSVGPLIIADLKMSVFFTEPSQSTDNSSDAAQSHFTNVGSFVSAEVEQQSSNPDGLTQSDDRLEETTVSPYKTIFASYSHADQDVVLACRNAYIALGDTVLIDIDTLRSGEQFDDALMRLIDASDIFQLFWSTRSAASRYVTKEWTYALGLDRQQAFIRPVYWEKPMPALPDKLEELRIHFKHVELPTLTRKDTALYASHPFAQRLDDVISLCRSGQWEAANDLCNTRVETAESQSDQRSKARLLVNQSHVLINWAAHEADAMSRGTLLDRALLRAGEAHYLASLLRDHECQRAASLALYRVCAHQGDHEGENRYLGEFQRLTSY